MPQSPPAEPQKILKLAPVLDLKTAAPLAEQLLALRGSDIRIDGSAVERLGAQCLQVLLAARQTWRADSRDLAIDDASEALKSAVAQMGATAALLEPTETRS